VCMQAGATRQDPIQRSPCSEPDQPQVAELQLQLEAARKEVAQLRARLAAAAERAPEESWGLLAAERDRQAAALRAEDQRIASGNQGLQAAWKGMVDELKEQLKVRCCGIQRCWLQDLELSTRAGLSSSCSDCDGSSRYRNGSCGFTALCCLFFFSCYNDSTALLYALNALHAQSLSYVLQGSTDVWNLRIT
jgi:hypothetical protein